MGWSFRFHSLLRVSPYLKRLIHLADNVKINIRGEDISARTPSRDGIFGSLRIMENLVFLMFLDVQFHCY